MYLSLHPFGLNREVLGQERQRQWGGSMEFILQIQLLQSIVIFEHS